MAIVYALTSAVTSNDGGRIRIKEGEAFDSDHPTVKAHPDLFGDKPSKVRGSKPEPAPVETATADPGEKRSTRKARTDAD